MTNALKFVGYSLAVLWAIFQLSLALGPGLPDLVLLPVHTAFALAVTFALVPHASKASHTEYTSPLKTAGICFSVLAIGVSLAIGAYFATYADALSRRIPMVHSLSEFQLAIGVMVLALVLEAARRTAGMGIVYVVLTFVAYALLGHHLPGAFASSPLQFAEFIDQIVFGTSGIFGVPISVSASYVFYFVLFAAFLEISGGGRLFIDIALGLTKNARGGPAKAAVTGSALMGMASGSAVANVVSTGVFTIPLMKRAGYSPRMAAAVEALASTGAQIMPPLMGAAAFIMANTLGRPYSDIVVAALLPAILFFATVFIAVDFEARRRGLQAGTGTEDASEIGESRLMRAHLLIPLVYLVVCVVSGRSLMMSALEAIGLVLLVSWLRKSTRLYPRAIVEALAKGSARVINVAIPCAAAGIVVGVVAQTGIGLRFTEFLVGISGDNLIVVLMVVMVGCLIMGMGLPTTAAYIMAATLFAPAMVRIGVPPIGAHMFVFYFACLSMITPPVALASYAAASVAGSSASGTGWTAAFVGIPLFMLPFAFVTNIALLGEAGILEAGALFIWSLAGVAALVSGITGYLLVRSRTWEKWVLAIGGALVLLPSGPANVVGAAAVLAAFWAQFPRWRSGMARSEIAQTPQSTTHEPSPGTGAGHVREAKGQ